MLHRVDVTTKPLERYHAIIGEEELDALGTLAALHRGKRVAEINATACGGVSELLHSLVPLCRTLGSHKPPPTHRPPSSCCGSNPFTSPPGNR